MQQSSVTPQKRHVGMGLRKIVACSKQWLRQHINFRNFTGNDVITKYAFPHGFWEDVQHAFAELSLKFYNTNNAVNTKAWKEEAVHRI